MTKILPLERAAANGATAVFRAVLLAIGATPRNMKPVGWTTISPPKGISAREGAIEASA